ncbi:hypothetical protein ACFXB3_12755 [Streptomyces sp. NPDC059447]|uniref:hypothetical protein n=1 Tax=Streptomyces sp. NPDC059447 TaxID=3346834 RepID=UPI003695CC1F
MPRSADLEAVYRRIADLDLIPLIAYPGAGKSWPVLHRVCMKVSEPTWNNMRRQGGCRYCAAVASAVWRKVDPDASAYRMLERGYRPLVLCPGRFIPWSSECMRCHSTVDPTLSNALRRPVGALGCRFCEVSAKLDPDEAAAEMVSYGVIPAVPFPGIDKEWPGQCTTCFREVSPMLGNARRRANGCRWCAPNGAVSAEEAEELLRLKGGIPMAPYPGATTVPWPSRCSVCKTEISPTVHAMRRPNSLACWLCGRAKGHAAGGFKVLAPAVVYVVEHRGYGISGAGKYGVSGSWKSRRGHHRLQGFDHVTGIVECRTGRDALILEDAVEKMLRAEGIGPYVPKFLMPHGGWTETWDLALRPALSVLEFAHADTAPRPAPPRLSVPVGGWTELALF